MNTKPKTEIKVVNGIKYKVKPITIRTGRRFVRNVVENNFLKHQGFVMAWARRTYGLGTRDLEILFFLYDEGLFTKTKMNEYAYLFSFGKRKLMEMIDGGYIKSWAVSEDRRYLLYELTLKSKNIVKSVYNKLNGNEEISVLPEVNEIAENISRKDRAYSIYVKKFNRIVKTKKEVNRKAKSDVKKPKRKKRVVKKPKAVRVKKKWEPKRRPRPPFSDEVE